jgi:hypothetical protein
MLFDSVSLVEIPAVHCESHCQTDFGDVRFYNAADAELKYWIDWGTLTGATPNQSVRMWVAASPGTSSTEVTVKYGDTSLTDVSDSTIFIKCKTFESGSDGDSIADADEDWTVDHGAVEIDTAQKASGTRSAKLVGGSSYPLASFALTAGTGYAIRSRMMKVDGAGDVNPLIHGNGTKRINIIVDSSENIKYQNAAGTVIDTGVNCTAGEWGLYEICNIDWTAGTLDLYFNNARIASGATIHALSVYANQFLLYSGASAGNDAWIDDIIVRKYASPEPVWGTWGAEEEIGSTPTGPSGIKALGPTASASIKAYGPTAWGSVKAL